MSRSIPPVARRFAVVLVALFAVPLILAVLAGPGRAQGLRNDLWVTDGTVFAEAFSGNTLYIGGGFTRVGPAIGAWAPVDSAGNVVSPAPLVTGTVYCSAPDGNGGWFLGGDFVSAQGQPRSNLAHFDANGQLFPWNPTTNNTVYAMLLFAGRLYVGGAFTAVDGQGRGRLAVVDTASGGLGTWNPDLDGDVHAITSFGSTFLVGGQFTHVGGVVRHAFAGIDTTGALWSLDPEPNGSVNAIAVVHRLIPNTVTVYLGGSFISAGGQSRANLAAIDATTGSGTFGQALAFNPGTDGYVNTILLTGGTVSPTLYVGGSFQHLGGQPRSSLGAVSSAGTTTSWNPGAEGSVIALGLRGTTLFVGGYLTMLGGQPRQYAGAVDAGTGAVSAWNPNPNDIVETFSIGAQTTGVGGRMTSMNGVTRIGLAAIDLTTGAATGWNPVMDGPVSALDVVDGHLYAGGTFAHVGGLPRANIAQIDLVSGQPGPWAPSTNGLVDCIADRPLGNGKSMIYFGGAFSSAAGFLRNNLAAMSDDPAGPGVDAWNPSPNSQVTALAVSGNTIFAGGAFTQVGAGAAARGYLAAFDTTGLANAWNPFADGVVNALAVDGSLVYAGGAFTHVAGQPNARLAAIDAATGSPQVWPVSANSDVWALAVQPGAVYVGGNFDSVDTSARTNLAALAPVNGSVLPWNPSPSTLLTLQSTFPVGALVDHAGVLYVAGSFTEILDSPHSNLAGLVEATTGVDPRPLPGTLAGRADVRGFPNPFHGGVAFAVNVPRAGAVDVGVYAVDGRLVRELRTTFAAAGAQRIDWDGRDSGGRNVPAGIYLVRARCATWEATGRVVRLR